MRRNLTRAERLKRTSDFDRVFAGGCRAKGRGARLIFVGNALGYNRFAVCPVRKYGSAVERNRAKRICREVYRTHKDRLESGYDIIMVIYPGFDTLHERAEQFVRLSRRAGIRRSSSAAAHRGA